MTDHPAQCGAKTRNGGTCHNPPMEGGRRCRMHGGASPRAVAAAKRRLEEQRAQAAVELFAARRDIHPADALLELVQWTAGEVDYWRAQVRLIERDDLTWGMTKRKTGGDDAGITEEAAPPVAYRMLTDASDRLAKYAAAALKAGVEERRVQLAENQGALVALTIRRILDRLNLTPDQVQLVPVVVPEELRALGGPA